MSDNDMNKYNPYNPSNKYFEQELKEAYKVCGHWACCLKACAVKNGVILSDNKA